MKPILGAKYGSLTFFERKMFGSSSWEVGKTIAFQWLNVHTSIVVGGCITRQLLVMRLGPSFIGSIIS
jgi:hypothetical protein